MPDINIDPRNITVEQAIVLRQRLEANIARHMRAFSEATGLPIKGLTFDQQWLRNTNNVNERRQFIANVRVDVVI
jgi:hypothetical protein